MKPETGAPRMDWWGGNEQCQYLRLGAPREPVRQIQKDTGKEASFGNAEQEASGVQLTCVMHKTRQHRHELNEWIVSFDSEAPQLAAGAVC